MQRPFVILSFEGPDRYAQAGGLGVRVTGLAEALAAAGHATDLIFVGDPALAATESPQPGLTWRRWSQWISHYHPHGVYDGEEGKVADYARSVPRFVVDEIAGAARARGERVVVMAEEWHTASAIIAIDALLRERGWRDDATLLWNANNTFGFERIDWNALQRAATLTTVSKFMKHAMWSIGVNPLVIPNGIPEALVEDPPPKRDVRALREALGDRSPLLLKVGRFDPDKRWMQAVEATAVLKQWGFTPRLLVRGGIEPHGRDVFERAAALGLRVEDVRADHRDDPQAMLDAMSAAQGEVLNIASFLSARMLHTLYGTVDAVLANSGREPFGLVGLEVMASRGVAVTGATGEEYAEPFGNAVVVDTDDGRELATYLAALAADPRLAKRLRRNGRRTAERYSWPRVVEGLAFKIAAVDAEMRGFPSDQE
ncbi:MAG: glycosyltransferase [bacterium]|nr:glycosyltransferase [bacterium]